MYKFTNGIVVFDKKTRDKYVKSGMHLVEEKEKVDGRTDDRDVKEEHSGNDKKTRKHKK